MYIVRNATAIIELMDSGQNQMVLYPNRCSISGRILVDLTQNNNPNIKIAAVVYDKP